jgi:hypothetical protein
MQPVPIRLLIRDLERGIVSGSLKDSDLAQHVLATLKAEAELELAPRRSIQLGRSQEFKPPTPVLRPYGSAPASGIGREISARRPRRCWWEWLGR